MKTLTLLLITATLCFGCVKQLKKQDAPINELPVIQHSTSMPKWLDAVEKVGQEPQELPDHALLRPFIDQGHLIGLGGRPMFGSDPFLLKHKNKYVLYYTYGPTREYSNSPGTYVRDNDSLQLTGWRFERIALRAGLESPEGVLDSGGVETFTATKLDDWLIGMYHGANIGVRTLPTINQLILTLSKWSEPYHPRKIQVAITEEMVKEADHKLTTVWTISEPSLQWDNEKQFMVGTISVDGVHNSNTEPDLTNPLGGKAGRAWRTHVIWSYDLRNWGITAPIIIPPESYTSSVGANSTSHSACVIDPRSPRLLHVFTTWSGNFSRSHEHAPKGLRHFVSLFDSTKLVFHPNPNMILEVGPEGTANGGHIGGPAPLLEHINGKWQWSMIYHADNRVPRPWQTQKEIEAILSTETRGRRHQRLAIEGINQ